MIKSYSNFRVAFFTKREGKGRVCFALELILWDRWDRWDKWDKWEIPIKRSVTHQSYQGAERVLKGNKGLYFLLFGPFCPFGLFGLLSREINLLLEGVRLGLSQKKTPRDSTQTYSPRGLTFSDGPRMTPYHNKF